MFSFEDYCNWTTVWSAAKRQVPGAECGAELESIQNSPCGPQTKMGLCEVQKEVFASWSKEPTRNEYCTKHCMYVVR